MAGTCKHSAKFGVVELNAKILAAKRQTKPAAALGIDLWRCAVCFRYGGTGLLLTTTAAPESQISKGNVVTAITRLKETTLARSRSNSGILLIHRAKLQSKRFGLSFNCKANIITFL